MPRFETWRRIPAAIRDHLIEPMRDPNVGLDDLNRLDNDDRFAAAA